MTPFNHGFIFVPTMLTYLGNPSCRVDRYGSGRFLENKIQMNVKELLP